MVCDRKRPILDTVGRAHVRFFGEIKIYNFFGGQQRYENIHALGLEGVNVVTQFLAALWTRHDGKMQRAGAGDPVDTSHGEKSVFYLADKTRQLPRALKARNSNRSFNAALKALLHPNSALPQKQRRSGNRAMGTQELSLVSTNFAGLFRSFLLVRPDPAFPVQSAKCHATS